MPLVPWHPKVCPLTVLSPQNLVIFLAVAMATPSAKSMFLSLGVNSRHSFQANPLR